MENEKLGMLTMSEKHTIRLQLCSTLLNLMEDKPINDITVTQLVRDAHVSRSSFYGYFDSIYDVLDLTENRLLEQLPTYTKCIPGQFNYQVFRKTTFEILTVIHDHLDAFRILSSTNAMNSFQIKMDCRDEPAYQQLIQSFQPNLTAKEKQLLTQYTLGGRWRLFIWWENHADEVTVDMMMDAIDKVIKNMPIVE